MRIHVYLNNPQVIEFVNAITRGERSQIIEQIIHQAIGREPLAESIADKVVQRLKQQRENEPKNNASKDETNEKGKSDFVARWNG